MGIRIPSYPDGIQGSGLVLSRCALATLCVLPNTLLLYGCPSPVVPILGTVVATCFVLGLATRIAATATAAILAFAAFYAPEPEGWLVLLQALQAASLVLQGPGAYSADSRLFGRRVIRVRPPPHD